MALGKRLINTGAAAAACSTDSVQAFGADAAYSSNVALYQLDGNDDDTTTNYDGTSDTGVTYSATGAKFGQAATFSGLSSSIVVPNTSKPSLSTASVSLWVKTTSTNTQGLVGEGISGNHWGNLHLYISNNKLVGRSGNASNANNPEHTSVSNVNTGLWVHCVVTITGNTQKIYINGVLENTATLTVTRAATTSPFSIGQVYVNGSIGQTWTNDCDIDQVRIFDKAISAEDVATLYAETTSTASNTNPLSEGAGVALYTMDYDASEASGYYAGTPTNVEFGVGGKINYGARFNGSSSKIELPTSTFSPSTFSLSAWCNVTSDTDENTILELVDNQTYPNNTTIVLSAGSTASSSRFLLRNYTTNQYDYSPSGTVSKNVWKHYAMTYDGSTVKSYIDGSLVDSGSLTLSNTVGTISSIQIGLSSGSRHLNGDLDQVRIFSKALSSDEVDELYAETACVYTCTTDDVNYPFSDGTNVEAYYKLDNSSEDYVGGNDGTDTNVEYRFGRFGQAAVFNGSSSYITSNSLPSIGTGDFTFSCWFNQNSGSSQGALFSTTTQWFAANGSVSPKVLMVTDDTVTKKGDTAYSQDTWNHAVFARESGVLKIYQNGTEVFSGAYTDSWDMTQFGIGVARAFGSRVYYFNGSIDQVRIYSTALTSSQVTELYEEKPCADTSNFKTVLYTGNGGTQYISNVGFEPDMVWAKARSNTHPHVVFDIVRGENKQINPDETSAEVTRTSGAYEFETNGFTVSTAGNSNNNNYDYVAWAWKSGGEAVQNTQGDITSDVSANTESGFSIVKWTGDGTSNPTVGHGLNQEPDLYIVKELDNGTVSWLVGGNSTLFPETGTSASFLRLNTSDDIDQTGIATFGNSGDNLIKVGARTNNGEDSIAYCFHSVTGYSKIGSYTGNGSSTGPNVTLGFTPSFLMVKRTDSGDNWLVFDNKRNTTNPTNLALVPNSSAAESVGNLGNGFNFLSNGFEVVSTDTGINANGGEYIYMAFK